MRSSRVHTHQVLSANTTVELGVGIGHYLLRVLRLKPGEPVILFNGDGHDYPGTMMDAVGENLLVRLGDRHEADNESVLKTTLVQSISRGERMDYSLQKATELGVHCIQLLLSERVEVRLTPKRLEKRLAHWRGVVVSACEQSGRACVPEVSKPISLNAYLAQTIDIQRLVLDPGAEQKLSACKIVGHDVAVLVGPEGGFSAAELEQVCQRGVQAVQLGPRILRTESAGPAALAVLQAMMGDF